MSGLDTSDSPRIPNTLSQRSSGDYVPTNFIVSPRFIVEPKANKTPTQKILCPIWRFVFQHWLGERDVVVKVTGWRTALVDRNGYSRVRMTPCLWFEGMKWWQIKWRIKEILRRKSK